METTIALVRLPRAAMVVIPSPPGISMSTIDTSAGWADRASSRAGPESTTPTTLASGRESRAWLKPSANNLWSSAIMTRIIGCPIQ